LRWCATASIRDAYLHTRTLRLWLLLLLPLERLDQERRQEQCRGSAQGKAMSHEFPSGYDEVDR
jgi:hypothetical protein